MTGLVYEVSKGRTDDLLREGERQRLASAAERAKPTAPPSARRRSVLWPFRRVARAGSLAGS